MNRMRLDVKRDWFLGTLTVEIVDTATGKRWPTRRDLHQALADRDVLEHLAEHDLIREKP